MAKSASLRAALVQKVHWRLLVLDEGHMIKNVETEIAQTVRKMHFVTALLLTGTPLQNNLVELWGLLNFLFPDVFVDRGPFADAFDLASARVDATMLEHASRLLRALMLRRLKEHVEKGLPPKLETVVACPLAEQQLFWYRRLLLKDSSLLTRAEAGGDGDEGGGEGEGGGGAAARRRRRRRRQAVYKNLLNTLMQLRKVCDHPFLFEGAEDDPDATPLEELVGASGKLRVLDRLLLKLHAKGHRVALFSQFARMIDVLDDYCRLRGWRYTRLTGATNRVQRMVNIESYNRPGSRTFLFLMTTRAGGLGINLQTADTVVLFDSDWNPQADLQAMARVHRLGQRKPVHIYRLVSGGTAEGACSSARRRSSTSRRS